MREVEGPEKAEAQPNVQKHLLCKSANKKAQHRAFPRGPPPQYYRTPAIHRLEPANLRMGSGEPG